MFCKHCGAEMNEFQAVCLNCGVKKGDGMRFCAYCGKEPAMYARFCNNCGAPTGIKPPAPAKDPNYLAGNEMLLIALLCFFVGGFGVHNFVMGENKKGAAKLILTFCGLISCGITTIACAVITLIEFVNILTDKYVVNTEKWF
ncbi:MAG: TM2 domain-containing protein [Clostridia bacterium]|nr:TM2 domain-containing protein [Clostridia bacterium]